MSKIQLKLTLSSEWFELLIIINLCFHHGEHTVAYTEDWEMLCLFFVDCLGVTQNLSDHSGVWRFCILDKLLLITRNIDSVNLMKEILNLVNWEIVIDWNNSSSCRFKELNVRGFNVRFLWVYFLK